MTLNVNINCKTQTPSFRFFLRRVGGCTCTWLILNAAADHLVTNACKKNVIINVNVIYLPTLHRRAQELVKTCTYIKIELEFRVSAFLEGGKPENPKKNETTTNSTQLGISEATCIWK